MAIAKKQIVSRIPKSFDTKHLGEEPAYSEGSGEITTIELMRAFNWYNYFNDYKSAAKMLIDNYPSFAKIAFNKTEKQIKNDITLLKKVSHFDIPPTIAYMSRMLIRNCKFNEQQTAKIEYELTRILDKGRSQEKKEKIANLTKAEISIEKRTRDKANEMLGDIEGEIDNFLQNDYKSKFSMYEWLQGNSVKTVYCAHIKEIYQELLDELLIAKNKEDEQVVESYSFMTATQLNRFIKFTQSIISDADTWSNNNKKVKTSRKKKTIKTVKVDKLLSKLQYLKTFNELKLVSIAPEKILGAGQLVVYNTKYKKLSHFYAASSEGFSVKGTTLQNVSEKSITKRLRNPENVLTELQKCGTIAMRKMINGIKTKESIANHRINNNTILLKVFK